MSETPTVTLPPTLLSTIQNVKSLDKLSPHVLHPFASSAESSSARLQELVHSTDEVLHSLNVYLATPMTDPKLVSILRQHIAISHSFHNSDRTIGQAIEVLRNRPDSLYGEDIPLDRKLMVEWCLSRLKTWSTSVGMETFPDEERNGRMTIVLGGKVLVVDIDLAIDRTDILMPRMDVMNAKTSYAIPNGMPNSTTEGSFFLDALLAESIRNFCVEVQKDEDVRNPKEATRLGKRVVEHLSYLMTLDKLAMREEDKGIRWFTDMLQLGLMVEKFAESEARSVASSLSATQAPLDIYLIRSHALPLPYLNSPSISFLAFLSPLAYLSLLRSSPANLPDEPNTKHSQFDIPLSHLRKHLTGHPRFHGATIATLSLCPVTHPQLYPASLSMLSARPSFPLVPEGSGIDHVFPQTIDAAPSSTEPAGTVPNTVQQYTWILDFTEGGKYSGVVMSQSRMRDIEVIVNPLSAIDDINTVGIVPFGAGSWVDLLLNPANTVYPEHYTTIYRSPTSLHPPLRLRLSAPNEPGFLLERVRVHNIKEIWGILEVVREQCWLNEILNGCRWEAEDVNLPVDYPSEDLEQEVNEELLQAVLAGTILPRTIPVNIYLPSHSETSASLFDSTALDSMSIDQPEPRRPKIVMTSPEHALMSGLVEITVAYDEKRARGVSVDIRGALGADLDVDVLEEVCRRGGTLGLSGRVWAKVHGS